MCLDTKRYEVVTKLLMHDSKLQCGWRRDKTIFSDRKNKKCCKQWAAPPHPPPPTTEASCQQCLMRQMKKNDYFSLNRCQWAQMCCCSEAEGVCFFLLTQKKNPRKVWFFTVSNLFCTPKRNAKKTTYSADSPEK